MDRVALLIEDLAAAEYRPKAALREALKHPSAVAEATLPLLEGAADGRELTPEETYPDVEVDVDELLAQGRAVRVDASDPDKKRGSGFLLYAMPPGRPASEEVCFDARL